MQTVIGAFDTAAQAETAARDLVSFGVIRDDISIVANNASGQYAPVAETAADGTTVSGHAIGHDAKVGAEWGAGIGFLVGLTGFAFPGVGWIAGAGWLWGTILGAGTGAIIGGLVGALTSVGVPEPEAQRYSAAVRHGSILVAVRANDAQAQQIANILDRDGAINVEERVDQYRQLGYMPNSTDHVSREYGTTYSPGIKTGGRDIDGTPDQRGITEKAADALTGDRIDDKTGKPVV